MDPRQHADEASAMDAPFSVLQLSPELLLSFERRGWLCTRGVLTARQADALVRAVHAHVVEHRLDALRQRCVWQPGVSQRQCCLHVRW
eukprot:69969-Chlamydomonas_euryale.AAC.2